MPIALYCSYSGVAFAVHHGDGFFRGLVHFMRFAKPQSLGLRSHAKEMGALTQPGYTELGN